MYIKNGFQSMKKFYFHLHFHLKKQYRKSLLYLSRSVVFIYSNLKSINSTP
ncbi:hypothetical protein AB434_0517 [Heyndrickxia coagulans]|uniref:Uncharacterized protein n=1 Tax=Heyndrickxia coagulans TaxID=1398 RepID=A0AAN0T2X9_HEYCO|nr:hypothetical protein SB48_HM08orf01008 [Heyndrickxia coagulans]AKN52922.1 hypothetical protein AB434_0517 [Heyndrickxia coagulans]KYC82911.1 hypothetical protein B4096_1905 [Heyndrickxia coagulans]